MSCREKQAFGYTDKSKLTRTLPPEVEPELELLNKHINIVQYMHQYSILFLLLKKKIAIKDMLSEVTVKSCIYLIISFVFSRKCAFYCWHDLRMTWKGRIKETVKFAGHYLVLISQSWSKAVLDRNLKFYTLKDSSKRLIICWEKKVGTVLQSSSSADSNGCMVVFSSCCLQYPWGNGTASHNWSWGNRPQYGWNPDLFSEAHKIISSRIGCW